MIAMVVAAAVSASQPSIALTSLAGRYYRRFPNSLIDGEKYSGQDVAEIMPISTSTAYVRVHLDYFNGHSCDIWGVASFSNRVLSYKDMEQPLSADEGPCELKISRAGNSLLIDDGDNHGCYPLHCGARGSLSDVRLPWKSRRPITYYRRIRASSEYQAALLEWRTGKSAR